MIPIPEYIKHISCLEKAKGNWIVISLHCSCGCSRFNVYENTLTKEERTILKPYYAALEELYCGKYGAYCTVDENGIRHFFKNLTPLEEQGEKIEIAIPPKPYFAGISVVKAICVECCEEHILFDSRYHGCDGMISNPSDEEIAYRPVFKPKTKKPVLVEIKIENDDSLEDFNRNTGNNYSMDEYSNSFSWITIFTIEKSNKRKKLFDIETA